MKCKLPASEEDRYQRPGASAQAGRLLRVVADPCMLAGFIVRNDAGIEVCENRLSYLVAKGGAS